MKIKQIELIGFKSFADRTELPLHNGITCIVGPNGCGKSNIVDAFRWVLGEQSAKSLRGEKMEEVIFQGSTSKKQKGMAEVTLILSQSFNIAQKGDSGNSCGTAEDASSDETAVSRRLYRSGESEYLLNKRQCRLKDIKDIFLDTGLDVKSYSILDQGKITEIINAKPIDRRFLIEEVAGVMKYKVRKAEALSKLESSRQNLQRINDIIYEVKRQINSLDRQVKKAERYKRLIAELRLAELRTAKRGHTRISNVLNSLTADIERLKEEDSTKRGELSTLENFIEAKRLELVEKEKTLSELENKLDQREKALSDAEKHIAVLKTNIENKKIEISRLINQQDEIRAKKQELVKKIEELNEAELTILSEIDDLSVELSEKKEFVSNIEIVIGDKESEIENKRKDLFKLSEDLSFKKNELNKLQSSNETLKYRESVSLKDIEDIKGRIEDLQKTITEDEELIRLKTEEHKKLTSEKESLMSEIENLKDSIEEQKMLLSKEREEFASNISRLNSLKELIIDRSLTDFLVSKEQRVEEMKQHNTNEANQNYVVLSDIISADKDHEAAIEAALLDRINSIVINRIEDVISVVKIIKEKHLARTAMLYAGFKSQGAAGRGQESTTIVHNNIIGRVSDFIALENTNSQKIVSSIIKNTYIVKDLRSAIEIINSEPIAHNSEITLVTPEGEVINSNGWLFAGQGKDILKRKREIKELQQMVDNQKTRILELESRLNTTEKILVDKKDVLKNAVNSIGDIEKETSLLIHSLKNQKDELERNTRRLSLLNTEIFTILQERESLEKFLISKTEDINELERRKHSINVEITETQHSMASLKTDYEDARSQLTDMKLSLTSYKEKLDALKREGETVTDTISEITNKEELFVKEIQNAEEKIKESISKLREIEENIKAVVVDADRIKTDREALRESIAAENQELIFRENALKNIRLQIDKISSSLSELNSKTVENRLIKENIENNIMQKYGLDIKIEIADVEGFDSPENAAEDESRIHELNEKIRELGPVNLGTIEEYEELKNRYDFLTKQQQDLTMSIAELEEAISRINTTTKRRLREAYDALRTKFSEVFTILFGGGKADIILTDEENILESGLEIIARPPGKKLQNLNLLSGGEKALASLAILFAGFLIKPSPLCILDEADAPLDESNTLRFTQMLRDLSKETQFIIVTHNRTTMEASDYLYGITMEEPGVSKAISLQFADVEFHNHS